MPIRVTDTVVVDPIVANNMVTGLLHMISLGWPTLAAAIDLATREGIVICAGAGQLNIPVNTALRGWEGIAAQVEGATQPLTVATRALLRFRAGLT